MGRQTSGSSSNRDERSLREARAPAEAAWRGIAVALFFIVPIMSWAAADVTIQTGIDQGWPLPAEMVGPVRFPPEAYTTPGVNTIVNFLGQFNNLLGVLVLTIFYIIILAGLLSFVYSVIYRMNVPRYGKYDVPPDKRRAKPYKR